MLWFGMVNSVLFPAIMIKMLNFSTCFNTRLPIKTQNDTYKSISLTSLKTQRDIVCGFFKNWIHHICVLPRQKYFLLLLHISQTLIYWDNQNIGTEGWILNINILSNYTNFPNTDNSFWHFFQNKCHPSGQHACVSW